jgi:CDP-glucose 4,6-dehydratase
MGDRELLERTVADYKIQIVFHLAAQPLTGTAFEDPLSTLETNVRGAWNLLEACRRSPGVRAVLLASTYQVYGDQGQLVCTEETPLAARDPYGISKSCADLIAETYAMSYGLPLAMVRSGNLFGGGDENRGRIVPSTIESILRGERPIIRSDGETRRDYLYVEDSAAAFLLLAEKLAGNPDLRGQSFNFSNEDPISVLDLVREILSRMQSSLEPDIRREFSGGNRHQYISSAKARAALGWRPRFTLGEGLDRTIAWYRGNR